MFCSCKPELFKDEPEFTFLRQLRPTQSELGQVDPAAHFEFQKGTMILYEANSATSCLVEMDEEPPHPLNDEAVEIVLTAALMMKARPVDEVHVMRKTVIDGSNTTGFQRTCVIALDGEIIVKDKKIPIQHASLEEDAARKTGKMEGNVITYRIDRLGIPLIEVATAPVIYSPDEAKEAALEIGKILRATGKVMRGLGTIRQDLNISIPNGALIEVKGVQDLELISVAVENEVKRQLGLIKICDDLKRNSVRKEDLTQKPVDVTEVFANTKCKVIRKALDQKQKVFAAKLNGFGGFLRRVLLPDFRLGTEMADRARFWGRVGGIFHTDELPAYGITEGEVLALRTRLTANEKDSVVFVADKEENCLDALAAVLERACEALDGVPEETRMANPDGTTRYMRPRPGSARMYPETDIPVMEITHALLEEARSRMPEMPEKRIKRLVAQYKINEKLAKQLVDSEYVELFETITKESKISTTIVAAFLTETLKSLKRDGYSADRISEDTMRSLFSRVSSGEVTKEALTDISGWLSEHLDSTVEDAIRKLGLRLFTEREIESLVDKAIEGNPGLLKEQRGEAFGVIMGIVMREVRGKAQPDTVSRIVRDKLKEKKK